MDPNELLRQMRDASANAATGVDVRANERALRWMFEQLDEWLMRGGFLPKDWRPKE
jgi:hypothetical protein